MNIEYICKTIGNLSGMPIRVYQNNKKIFYYSILDFIKDPINYYENEILSIDRKVGYYVTKYFNYYGIINTSEYKVIIGPTKQINNTDQELKEMALDAGVDIKDVNSFIKATEAIVPMPLESILQIMCVFYYVLTNEEIDIKDITIVNNDQLTITDDILKLTTSDLVNNDSKFDNIIHNAYFVEQKLINIIENGNIDELNKLIKDTQSVRAGKIANDQLRQYKNTFIVSTTLASRAAISGGLDFEEALSLSDKYIQKCELLNNIIDITNLQFHMILEYTKKINELKNVLKPSKLYNDVVNYISNHITEQLTTSDIAYKLGVSRSTLSNKFKEASGINLIDYIQEAKIKEARRLLKYTNKSLLYISEYLGYSSQSHFTKAFKRITDILPSEYREKSTTNIISF